jgi:hypothetical protein
MCIGLSGAQKRRVPINQHIAHIGAFADGAELQAGGQFGRQIFEAVDGQIRLVLEQRDLKFLGEETFGKRLTFLSQRSGLQFVAGRFDDFQLKLELGENRAALVQHQVGLRQCESAAAGRNLDDVFIGHAQRWPSVSRGQRPDASREPQPEPACRARRKLFPR